MDGSDDGKRERGKREGMGNRKKGRDKKESLYITAPFPHL